MKKTCQLFSVTTGRFTGMSVTCEEAEADRVTPPDTVALDPVEDPFSWILVDGTLQPFERPAAELRPERMANARRDIVELESRQARAIREQAIGRGGTQAELRQRLEAIDDQIITLRAILNE
jgi:hypothetical protein